VNTVSLYLAARLERRLELFQPRGGVVRPEPGPKIAEDGLLCLPAAHTSWVRRDRDFSMRLAVHAARVLLPIIAQQQTPLCTPFRFRPNTHIHSVTLMNVQTSATNRSHNKDCMCWCQRLTNGQRILDCLEGLPERGCGKVPPRLLDPPRDTLPISVALQQPRDGHRRTRAVLRKRFVSHSFSQGPNTKRPTP
jgi:hypothetical protein